MHGRFVQHLGMRGQDEEGEVRMARRKSSASCVPHRSGTFKHAVHCPEGHVMRAKVVKEMLVSCYAERYCERCQDVCDGEVSRYLCKECDIVYCNACARSELGLPELEDRGEPLDLLTGDILLAGPDSYGIHHVILVKSGWKPVDPEVAEVLHLEPGADVLACDTIESTQGAVGSDTWWYPTTTFFVRHQERGTLTLVADLPPDSTELQQAITPVPTKLLLHPFRSFQGGLALDEEVFLEVIDAAAANSVRYGRRTAVKSVIHSFFHRERIDQEQFQTEGARKQLAELLSTSWTQNPICASVAIACWQQYFFKACASSDEAVQQILQYMPHWCHKTTPAALVKNLTLRGWVMSDTADGANA